jgi:hypothetical protein
MITRKIVRWLISVAIFPIFWVVGVPFWLFLDYLDGTGFSVTEDIIDEHISWLFFRNT